MPSSPPSVWAPASAGSPSSPVTTWSPAAGGSPSSPVFTWTPAAAGSPSAPVSAWEPASAGSPSSPVFWWAPASTGSPISPLATWAPAAGGSPSSPAAVWNPSTQAGGRILISGGDPAGVNVTLMPTGALIEGRASWSNTGTDTAMEYPFVKLAWDPDEDYWVLAHVPDATGTSDAQWTGAGSAIDPLEVTEWTAGENAAGNILLTSMPVPPAKPVRAWRISGTWIISENNEPVLGEDGTHLLTEAAS